MVSSFIASPMLDAAKLDTQQGLFKVTMKANCEASYTPPFTSNFLIKLWKTFSISRHFKQANFGVYEVVPELGCVEDKRCSSSLKCVKLCQRNRLQKHLPLVVRMYGQKYSTLDNFPCKDAIES